MTTLHETEVDGVRCFWVETGRPTLAAQLVFRYGMADEDLTESGWQHLLEHSALHGRGGGALQVNGSVSLLHTDFSAHGPADAVAGHLEAVSSWLASPVLGELDRERGVLRAEAGYRGSSPAARALGWRYGARGPGTATYDEPGLGRATVERLQQRARRVFTQGNAVLVLDGPPPPGLRLDLPAGELVQPRAAVPCEVGRHAYQEEAGLVLSGQVERSVAMTLLPELVQRLLTDQFRGVDGAAYAPWSAYEPVDHDVAIVVAGSDLQQRGASGAGRSVLKILQKLAHDGVSEDRLGELVAARLQVVRDPYAAVGLAARAGHHHLLGLPPLEYDEVVDELLAVTADEVTAGARQVEASLLLGLPSSVSPVEALPVLTFPLTAPSVQGRRYRHANWPAAKPELVIGETGAELRFGQEAQRVLVTEVEALFVFEDGARHLLRSDGYGVTLEPAYWRDGAAAAERLDSLVPPDRHLPLPARGGEDPELLGFAHRWWIWLRPRSIQVPLLWIVAVLCVNGAIAGAVMGVPLVTVALGISAWTLVRALLSEPDLFDD